VPALQPTASIVLDGDDPDDRIVVIGCEDGHVRFSDKAAMSDDGYRIDSRFLVHLSAAAAKEYRFQNLDVVLKSGRGGCSYELFQGDEPQALEPGLSGGELHAGRNFAQRARMRGAACWIRFRNAVLDESWGFEQGSIKAYKAGRFKRRT
jgi:hypothetical protein